MNKKIMIPLFATVMGLSLAGGIGGAVAWYQYNTRVNASFVGLSVAQSGVLQITSNYDDDDSWTRDVYAPNADKMAPVTFGATDIEPNEEGKVYMKKTSRLPDNAGVRGGQAYAYPEAGKGPYEDWQTVKVGKEYVQQTIYLRALKVDSSANGPLSRASESVYLSNIVLEGATTNKTDIGKALRLHLDILNHKTDGTDVHLKSLLISANETADLPLFGNLDLDADGSDDTVGGMAWTQDKDSVVTYGRSEAYQETYGINQIKAEKYTKNDETNHSIPEGKEVGDFKFASDSEELLKRIAITPETGAIKIVATVWLEGWEELSVGNNETSTIWDATKTGDATVHVGMTFDVGKTAFRD